MDHQVYQREDDMKKTECEAIAKRAYEKFVQRGGGHGHHEKGFTSTGTAKTRKGSLALSIRGFWIQG